MAGAIQMTRGMAEDLARYAADRRMRTAGRTTWNSGDVAEAAETFASALDVLHRKARLDAGVSNDIARALVAATKGGR